MKDLKQEIKKLDKLYREVVDKAILKWIESNVKDGMIFWLSGYTGLSEELEFKKVDGAKIVFWNKTFNKEEILDPFIFLSLEKEEIIVSAKSPDFCRISEPNIIVEGANNRNMILCEY